MRKAGETYRERHLSPLWLWGLCALLLLATGANIIGSLWRNAGMIAFNQTLAAVDGGPLAQRLARPTRWLQEAARLSPDSASTAGALGYAYLWQGREAKAVQAWQVAPEQETELIYWGEIAHGRGLYAEALRWYGLATTLQPMSANGWYKTGLTQEKQEQWPQALAAFTTGMLPGQTNEDIISSLYFHSGWLRQRQLGDLELAEVIHLYTQALQADAFADADERVQTHFHLAEALWDAGDMDAAAAQYQWVVAQAPAAFWGQYAASLQLGRILALQGQTQAAEAQLLRAITIDDQPKWAFRQLASLYENAGRLAEAAAMYRQVLMRDSGDGEAAAHLSQIEAALLQP